MRTDLSSVVAAGVVVFDLLLAACAASTTAPTASPATPVGISPTNNAVIAQNDPVTGCALLPGADATRGLGFSIPFHWTAPSQATDIAGYELYASNPNALNPAIDTVVTATDYTQTKCNTFVADSDLHNWQWRVRAKDSQGQYKAWSNWSTFQFAPCRLSDGTPCHSPS